MHTTSSFKLPQHCRDLLEQHVDGATIPCGLDGGETFGGDNGKATTRRARVMLKSCPVPGERRGFACCVSFRILREQSSHRGMRQQPHAPNLARIRLLDFGRRRRKLQENAFPRRCCLHQEPSRAASPKTCLRAWARREKGKRERAAAQPHRLSCVERFFGTAQQTTQYL